MVADAAHPGYVLTQLGGDAALVNVQRKQLGRGVNCCARSSGAMNRTVLAAIA
jgi:hypothetical protein